MTEEEGILFVRGMIKCCRGGYRDDEANSWARKVGWYTLPDGLPDGKPRDFREPDWTVDEETFPALFAASRSDGAAYKTASRLLCAYLRWGRPMPDCLAKYAISKLMGHEKRPHRKQRSNQFRDEIAAVAINWLDKNAGIAPDKSPASYDRMTGIHIVTEALSEAGYTATLSAIRSAYYRNKGLV